MTFDTLKDLSILTTIDESVLVKLFDKINLCIANDVNEAMIAESNLFDIDLNFGILHIKIDDDSIKYRFEPSKRLESLIGKAVEQENKLVSTIESSLASKVQNVYKTLL